MRNAIIRIDTPNRAPHALSSYSLHMANPLASQPTLDPDAMWRAMRVLLDRVFGVIEHDSALDDCLDIVVELLGADRGLVLVVDEVGTPRTINARACRKPLGPLEREEISKTIIREALESGECVTWDMSSLSASSSVSTLGILAALAAPLHRKGATSGVRAVLYVDVRDPRKHVERSHVEFFMSSALLIGALLDARARGESDRARLGEAMSHTTDARRAPPLDDVVAFGGLSALREEIQSAVTSELSVLVLGESGTGKTLLAQAIAEASGRRPTVRATLGGSDDLNTITSELFGHERGSYSGATAKRVGLVEFANGGTLILDELLNLPPHAQKLLLDFTQFGTYRPLGYDKPEPKKARVRIVGATNGDLRAAIRDGRFREDLYHRLAGVVLDLPPLRQRREDVPALAESTLLRADPKRRWSLSVETRRLLLSPSLEWSGNIRQLERVVLRARERALQRDPEATELLPGHFEARDLDGVSPTEAASPSSQARRATEQAVADETPSAAAWQRLQAGRSRIDEAEVAMVRRALADANGVVAQAARTLGVARTTLSSRLDILGLRNRGKTEG
jgi:transcriptional regulator with GAF, ATPase, and Fis domain